MNRSMPFVAALALLAALPARADWTGDLAMTVGGGKQESLVPSGKVRFRTDRMRIDMSAPMPMSMIFMPREKKMIRIDDERRVYTETDLSGAGADKGFPACDSADLDKCLLAQGFKKGGAAEANGQACEVYEIDRPLGGRTAHQKLYRPTKLKGVVFVRMETTEGEHVSRMDVTNLVEGKIADALFAPPAGYSKEEGRAPGMGGMGGPGGGRLPAGMTPQQMQELMKKYGHPPAP